MVRLTKIYTRTGDAGDTGIGDGSRVSKLDPRIVAGGSVDETNSWVGLSVTTCQDEDVRLVLTQLQQWLFDLGADVSCPFVPDSENDRCPRITAQHVIWMESEIDRFNERLSPLASFVLPGGSSAATHLHLARSVCRRAELDVLRLQQSATINPQVAVFLNRLSDLLFVLARVANDNGQSDVLWQLGTEPGSGDV